MMMMRERVSVGLRYDNIGFKKFRRTDRLIDGVGVLEMMDADSLASSLRDDLID